MKTPVSPGITRKYLLDSLHLAKTLVLMTAPHFQLPPEHDEIS
ncbi:hypothetical protein HMPREF0578_0492 [Mobiluncus mulieris 28-1]|uniref:Uncharacterized protein n=1 Tax=Mobiluncus mulieris ATCC 35239 TaxID=871571 RepID=E0QT73_9ACTO|nr:hypothetical protein HMPREF0577_1449 [Mobiluncus mulieris ATCC 35243]EEZ91454.1 hypothetical protein HMPREF0578_0492 [Mobiluncus mulieris 28-1]EFM45199.1 hypothetical protein HMPREF0580_2088 [Mobiluncus mulieris ATCC 35239]